MTLEQVYIAIGELWDKYSILLIKLENITNTDKIAIINKELDLLNPKMIKYKYQNNNLFYKLKKINNELWTIEDKLRIKENKQEFDDEFIQLARLVYFTNDKRAEIKNKINIEFGSTISEVKDYVNYNRKIIK